MTDGLSVAPTQGASVNRIYNPKSSNTRTTMSRTWSAALAYLISAIEPKVHAGSQ